MINLKHDQFKINAAKFPDLLAFVDGSGYDYPSPFQWFFENSLQARTSHAYNYFAILRFLRKPSTASKLVPMFASKHFKGLLFFETNAFFAAKHFVFFICPILLNWEWRKMILRQMAFFSSQCVKVKTINSH